MSSDGVSPADANVDTWFKYRMMYLLTVAVMFVLRWLFYPELAVLQFGGGDSDKAIEIYFQYRASFIILMVGIYAYSYMQDWHFERVSMAVLGLSVTALFLDYFNAYVYLGETPKQWIVALTVLRFLVVFCLLMNAVNARHAPKMPRRLWS